MKEQSSDTTKGKYYPVTAGKSTHDKRVDDLTKQVLELKKQMFSGNDYSYTEVQRRLAEDPTLQTQKDNFLEAHFGKSGLKMLKTLVLNKLLTGVFTHEEYIQYALASSQQKKELLMSILLDNPFLMGLMAKAAPWVINKAYDYLKPKVQAVGTSLLNQGIKKFNNSKAGQILQNTRLVKDANRAFNLDPEETENPLPALPESIDGPTSGLLTKPLYRMVSSSDVNIESLQAAFWPENEGYRVSLPTDNDYTSVLQATTYLTVPPTNTAGNLFLTIAPPLIDSTIFAMSFNAAGATITSPGANSNYVGPLNSSTTNFSTLRVSGMAVNIMNLIAPLSRSGTISVAVTNRSRAMGSTPTFSDMSMSMAFFQASFHADNYSAIYVPDEHTEWDLRPVGSLIATTSDIQIAIEGTQASVIPMKILVSYTLEFVPTITSRPLVNIGRPDVAPATLSAIQLMLKHYNSILITPPQVRGDFFRLLKSRYGKFMKIDDLSAELSTNFSPLGTSSYSSSTSNIAPTVPVPMNNMSLALRSRPPMKVVRDDSPVQPVTPTQDREDKSPELMAASSTIESIIAQYVLAGENISLNITEDKNFLEMNDGTRFFSIRYGKCPITLDPLEYPLAPQVWPAQLLAQFRSWIREPDVKVQHLDITSDTVYNLTLTVKNGDDLTMTSNNSLTDSFASIPPTPTLKRTKKVCF